MWAHELPAGWDKRPAGVPRRAKRATPRASPAARCSTSSPRRFPGSSAARPTSPRRPRRCSRSTKRAAICRPTNPGGRNLHFGIREHAMAAAVNGMVLCGLRAYGATFFVFTDYCRPSLRLAAIMKIPTHLRLHARFDRRRRRRPDASAGRAPGRLPGDSESDRDATRRRERNGRRLARRSSSRNRARSRSSLTRQNLPTLDRTEVRLGRRRGAAAATSWPTPRAGKPSVILIATGSELQLAVAAHEELTADGIAAAW